MGFGRSRMQGVDWVVAKHKFYFLAILRLNLSESWKHPPAKGPMKVWELYCGNRRLCWSFRGISVDRHRDPKDWRRHKVHHYLSLRAE
jgi:hypothetical protein